MTGVKWSWNVNNFPNVKKSVPDKLRRALFAEGNEIMQDSKANYCPVVTGELRNSGTVELVGDEVELKYTTPYARRVHEAPPEYGQGKNKYLEKPVLAAARGFQGRIRKRMKGY